MPADFEPERHVVTAITNANPAVVTAAAHGYTTGDIVRVNVPLNYGMRLPREEYEITVINANTFSINEDTLELDAFVVPIFNITNITQAAQAVVTAAGHNIKQGEIVYLQNVTGMTEVNGNDYSVVSIAGNDLTLNVDSTGFGAYAGAGTINTSFTYAECLPISGETDNIA